MLDMYKTITNAMQEREDKYISFSDLVDYLRSVNNGYVQDSIIGDYLLFIFKRFNPAELGDKADFFPIYISMDLSDVTRELEVSYDQEVFFKFAYSLCEGRFSKKEYWYFFLERKFVLNEINIDQQTPENLSKPVIDSTELQEEKAKNAQLQAEIERLKAENAELRAQLQDNAQRKSAVDSNDFSIYGHKSELLEILFKVIAEFWADSETPPKNSVIEQWIETNYPVKNYPYVSKAVRQYIATILRPQPKLK